MSRVLAWLAMRAVSFKLLGFCVSQACFLFAISSQASAETFSVHYDHVLGTSLDMTIVAEDRPTSDRAFAAALEEFKRLETILSTYDPASEISELNQRESAVVSDDLFAVLTWCEGWREQMDNQFSCRIGGLINAWRQAEEAGDLPSRPELRLLVGEIKRAPVTLDAATRTVVRPSPVTFSVDAVAKGYIIDRAFEAARTAAPTATGLLIDVGGDIRVAGRPEDKEAWQIGVSDPHQASDTAIPLYSVAMTDGAIATSGHSRRSYVIDGASYSHVLSPESGWPVEQSLAASAIAPDAVTADSLATTFLALSIGDALSLAEQMEGVETLIIGPEGRQFASSGWHSTVAQVPADPDLTDESASTWPVGYELRVDYEIPRINTSDYRAPYLAMWITRADKSLVRSLLMLGERARWQEENYYWYRRYARKVPILADAISQPSRRPGRYSISWNGLDDFGHRASSGDYVLNIEAAREHGGHTLLQIPLTLGNESFSSKAGPDGEVGRLELQFGEMR